MDVKNWIISKKDIIKFCSEIKIKKKNNIIL